MEPFQKIIWSEGMFLTPHHFQQWDNYYERLLNQRFEQLSPFNWGVTDLSISGDALTKSQVVITSFKAIMPDGLLVNMPDVDPLPLSRSLESAFAPSLDHLDIFIGVPAQRVEGANCRTDESTSSLPLRYTAEVLKVPDRNTGENLREISVGQKNSRLFFGDEEDTSYVLIKIAKVNRIARGTFVLRDSYIPPCLWFASSGALGGTIRGLLEMLYAKRSALVAHQRPAGEMGILDVRSFFLLHTINGFLPLLTHALQVGKVHPESLYLTMARLIGELSTVSEAIDPKDVPPYVHTDLARTFKDMESKIRVAVEGLTAERYTEITLLCTKDNVWVGNVPNEDLLNNGVFYLVVTGSMPEEQMKELIPRRVKLAGKDDLDLVMSRALPGVRLTYVARPAGGLPIRPGSHYFRLENQGNFWDTVVRSRTIAVSLSSALKDVSLEILVTKS